MVPGLAFRAAALVTLAGIAAASAPSRAHASPYDFAPFSIPGATQTHAFGINDAGQVAGYYYDAGYKSHGFVAAAGSGVTTIDVPGTTTGTLVNGISNAGQLAGSYLTSTAFPPQARAFLDAGGSFTTFAEPGAGLTYAYGVNNAGQVVGAFGNTTANQGFLYQGGTLTTLTVPGAQFVSYLNAFGINDAGQIVGTYKDARGVHGFVDTAGRFTAIDAPGASQTYAYGINAAGQVVGYYLDAEGGKHGFVDTAGRFTALDVAGGPGNTEAFSINDAGQVVGYYTDTTLTHSFSFLATPVGGTAVPEPASLLLLGTGLAGIKAVRRRRARG